MPTHVSPQSQHPDTPSTADLIDRLSRFDGPPELFLVNLLAVQCHLAAAQGGTILRAGAGGQPEVLAVYPPVEEGATAPVWLASAVESAAEVANAGQTATKPLHGTDDMYGAAAKRYLIMVPLRGGEQGVRGVTAFILESASPAALAAAQERLEITASLLSLYEMRLTLQRRNLDLQRVRVATETLASINEHNRIAGAAMALCNEAASRWRADRVSLGFLKGRYVHLKAMSHTEKFSRKMKLIQDVEATMEECLDQDVEILYPSSEQDTYVSRAAGELAKRYGPAAVVSLPLRRDGEVRGVLTLERPLEEPFDLEEIESLRLTGELCTARLVTLYESDRWFGARMAAGVRKGLGSFLGAKHTWLKVAAIGVFALIVFLCFAKGDYKVEAPFVFEATGQRNVSVPYDAKLLEILVHTGEVVEAGQVLARLETHEQEMELAQVTQAMEVSLRTADARRAKGETAEAGIAAAEAKGHEARVRALQYKIAEAEITSPIAGVIITPDLDTLVGTPMQTGKVLYSVAPLDTLWADLSVPEDQIGDVREGMEGQLAPVGRPDQHIAFRVVRITPKAEVTDQKNVYKVRVEVTGLDLAAAHRGMYPGAEGVAKINVDRRRYAWIWSRRLVNWVRMKLWW